MRALVRSEGLVRPKSLRDLAAEYLRTAIIDADVELGSLLSENALAEELGISKTPIHEALVILQSEGLVDILPQRGARVFQPSREMLLDLCGYRLLLETRALELAYERNRTEFVPALDAALRDMTLAWNEGRTKDYLRLDTDFHNLFFRYSDSPCVQAGSAQIAGRAAAVRTHLAGRDPHSRRTAFEEHKQIVNLLKEGRMEEIPPVLSAHVHRLTDLFAGQHPNQNWEDQRRAACRPERLPLP